MPGFTLMKLLDAETYPMMLGNCGDSLFSGLSMDATSLDLYICAYVVSWFASHVALEQLWHQIPLLAIFLSWQQCKA